MEETGQDLPTIDEEVDDAEQLQQSPPIHELPIEIMEYIFSFLDVRQRIIVERVCKRWSWIGSQVPWRCPNHLSIELQNPAISANAFRSIFSRCGKSIRHLKLTRRRRTDDRSTVSTTGIEIIGLYCPNLVNVTLVGLALADGSLQALAEKCLKLRGVCLRDTTGFGEEEFSDFLGLLHDLEHLYLDVPITGRSLGYIGPKLKSLSLRSPALQAIGLESVMMRCDYVRELRLTGCQIEDTTLMDCLYRYRQTIKVLHFESWYGVDWSEALRPVRILEELSLIYCSGVDDDLLHTLAMNCLHLTYLSICCTGSRVSDVGLGFLSLIPSLKVVNVSDNMAINGKGIKEMARQGSLEEVYASCTSAKDEFLIYLPKWCRNIHILDVRWNKQITNALVEAFSQGIDSGFLKRQVKLFVRGTSVVGSSKCERLELDYITQLSFPSFRAPIHNTYFDVSL